MAEQQVTVRLPDTIFERVQRIAGQNQQSIEDVLIDTITVFFEVTPDDVERSLAVLQQYADAQLWSVVALRLTWPHEARLRYLTAQAKAGMLSAAEQVELEDLLDMINRQSLLRSEALLLLKQRGYGDDVEAYLRSDVAVHLVD